MGYKLQQNGEADKGGTEGDEKIKTQVPIPSNVQATTIYDRT